MNRFQQVTKIAGGFFLLSLVGCSMNSFSPEDSQTMKCSYYSDKFEGRQTANGEIFSQDEMTAAHRYLPFGSRLFVSNPTNGNSVVVRVNDRGPFVHGRDLDLSRKAAEELGFVDDGLAMMNVALLEDDE